MIKILVTGANGQLGRTIHKFKNDYKNAEFIFCDSNELNITKKDSVESVFERYQPDYCINCAAYTNVEKAEDEPEKAFEVNAEGVKNLAEACKVNHTILIHISTDYVFDGEKGTPYSIDDITNPINEYGKSKLKGEQYIQDILDKYFIIRTSWLYSKEFGKNFYKTILDKAQKGVEIRVVDSQVGCPTGVVNLHRYVKDIVEGKNTLYGIKHYCDGEVLSWYDFARKIVKESGFENVNVVCDNSYVTKAKRPKYSVLDSTE
ncbi:dTDP-4-dehydrorhamnose reductase [Joostella sp. CR20]|uniref:dTDP-4-dehydrorhamnose reductase n=1 Tax=Joostella sp. CR20 TaxID=2804312 RepID=UPI00313B1020